jgi:hypothetical protein
VVTSAEVICSAGDAAIEQACSQLGVWLEGEGYGTLDGLRQRVQGDAVLEEVVEWLRQAM